MATWPLSQIRQKVRQVTGRLSPSELTNEQIDYEINLFYQYTFPAEVKLNKKFVYYRFLTTANQAYYDFVDGYTNFVPPLKVDYMDCIFYQDPGQFYENNPPQVSRLSPWTGNGSTQAFSTNVVSFPIMPGTVVITDNVEYFEDTNLTWTDNNVTLTGTEGGTATINYNTGVVSVTFASAPPNGQVIYLSYVLFNPGRPVAVLMYDSMFQFFPPPDTAYKVQLQAYKVPDALVNATDTPSLDEWGPCIAYGTARNIHSNFGEMDAYAEVTALYKEQVEYILARTEQDLLETRSAPSF